MHKAVHWSQPAPKPRSSRNVPEGYKRLLLEYDQIFSAIEPRAPHVELRLVTWRAPIRVSVLYPLLDDHRDRQDLHQRVIRNLAYNHIVSLARIHHLRRHDGGPPMRKHHLESLVLTVQR